MTSSADKSNGFTDVEMGPLLGNATHERKKKDSAGGSPSSRLAGKKSLVGGDTSETGTETGGTSGGINASSKKSFGIKGSGGGGGGGGTGGKVLFACTLYSFCSVGMVLTNKSLASSYNHLIEGDINVLLVVMQAIVAVISVEFCKKVKWVEYPSFDIRTAKLWAPVNIFFCLMLFTGMASLQYNNVPMVTVFKNITNIITAAGDRYFFGTQIEGLVMVAFGVMLAGACLAAKHDVHISPLGLFWMGANCIATAGYILYMKFATKTVKLSKFGMVFYNNVLCTVFLLPAALMRGELSLFLTSNELHTSEYYLKNFFAGFIGFFLNFASLNCVSQTGPSTYAMVGALNKIPISILGAFMFDEAISGKTWFFIGVSMMGGFLYSYAKLSSQKRKANRT